MDKLSLSGAIVHIGDTQEVGKKGFRKREVVVETQDKYPQKIKMEAIGDMIETLDGFSEGQEVLAYFNLRGNEYDGKFYTNLQVWRIEETVEHEMPLDPAEDEEPEPSPKSRKKTTKKAPAEPVEDSDLPF